MVSIALSDRLDSLIDDLILEGSLEAASLASILLAAKDSLRSNTLLSLSCQVWNANNTLKPSPDTCFALAGAGD
jgi:hypothetical protein